MAGLNATDFMMGDPDLDNFLDNYLLQLQDNTNGNPAARAPRGMPAQPLPLAGNAGMNRPQGMMPDMGMMQLPLQQQQQQQQLMGFGALAGMGAPNPLALGALGAPSHMFQQPLGAAPGQMPLGMGAPGLASAGAKQTAKTTRKGRAAGGGRQTKKSEPEVSSSDQLGDSGSDSASSDGEQKSRKKQITTDEAERRHQALQEKNRRAQRRFRERQKTKLQDLHKQIEDLTTKVSSLQSENAALHSRTSILEKVLDMRNEQIQVMQETKETTVYQGNEEDLASLQGVGGQLVQLTPDVIKELGSEQIYKIYQMYVKELSVRLVEVNRLAGTDNAYHQELEGLVKDLSMMIMRLGVIKPLETRKFIVVSRQYLGNTEAEVIELWKNVMKAIDLNDQQKREVVELKRMFLQKIEPIMEERKHLNVQIQSNLPHDTFHTKNALTYIKAHEAVIKLRDNLRAEQHVVLEFAIAVFRGVFRPKQMATLLVKCYPAVPDALGIASALTAELGELDTPQARQLAMQLGGYLEGSSAQLLGGVGPAHGSALGLGALPPLPGGLGLGGAAGAPPPLQLAGQQQQQQQQSSGGGMPSPSSLGVGSAAGGGAQQGGLGGMMGSGPSGLGGAGSGGMAGAGQAGMASLLGGSGGAQPGASGGGADGAGGIPSLGWAAALGGAAGGGAADLLGALGGAGASHGQSHGGSHHGLGALAEGPTNGSLLGLGHSNSSRLGSFQNLQSLAAPQQAQSQAQQQQQQQQAQQQQQLMARLSGSHHAASRSGSASNLGLTMQQQQGLGMGLGLSQFGRESAGLGALGLAAEQQMGGMGGQNVPVATTGSSGSPALG